MNNAQVCLLLAPSPPLLIFPSDEGPVAVELVSRSIDLVDLIHRVAEERRAIPVGNDEWKGAKKSLSKVLKRYGPVDKLKEKLGIDQRSLNWHILFRHAAGKVSLQPWVNVDYWLIHAEVDKLQRNGQLPKLEVDQKEATAVSALAELIAEQPTEKIKPALLEASSYWPDSQQVAFQTLTEESEQVISRFILHLTTKEKNLEQAAIPKLEIGEFPSWFVWSPTAINDLKDRHERIIETILASRPIPETQNFCSYQGTSAWLALSDITLNPNEATSVARIGKIASEIAKNVDSELIDILSLGPGDGVKDSKLLQAFDDAAIGIHYYPTDISPLMLGIAVGHVRRTIKNIQITGVVTDFSEKTLRTKELVLERKETTKPAFISMLGNTLGNIEQDWRFACSLASSLSANDYLLLETRSTNCLENTLEVEVKETLTRNFYLEPLSAINASYSLDSVYCTVEDERNGIAVKIHCKNVGHERFTPRNVELFKLKHYDNDFFDKLSEEIGAEIIFRSEPNQPFTDIALFRKN